ncbi:MAG: tetratricopeptide repeat protein [Alphaproteobacteria bacterium]|nr:tetratricopeptide repeat protein [Alphaproteobacteria bacterium]
MTKDKWGNPHSHTSKSAISALESATEQLAAYRGDPVGTIDAALKNDPDFLMGLAFRAGVFATASDKVFEPHLRKAIRAAEPLMAKANDRERGHIGAASAWLEGDFERATELWGKVAIAYPRDLLAIQLAHLGDFFHGHSLMLRDRVARVLPHWDDTVPGHGFLLGMHAFGLEESGEYALAEKQGRKAVAANGQDGWAVHAVAHVMEMEGRAGAGADWLSTTASGWEPESLFAYHNVWHWTLFHFEDQDFDAGLKLYDEKIGKNGFDQALVLVDGAAFLWRLTALGKDVGDRWTPVVDGWAQRVDDGYYAFNDMHAMMAFAATGREDLQSRLVTALKGAAEGDGTNAMMTREIGLPAARGIRAFGRGAFDEAVEYLLPLRTKAQLFGGSHAQRDVLSWTLIEAAIRAGDKSMADALAAERLAAKPRSPLNLAWQKRASGIR